MGARLMSGVTAAILCLWPTAAVAQDHVGHFGPAHGDGVHIHVHLHDVHHFGHWEYVHDWHCWWSESVIVSPVWAWSTVGGYHWYTVWGGWPSYVRPPYVGRPMGFVSSVFAPYVVAVPFFGGIWYGPVGTPVLVLRNQPVNWSGGSVIDRISAYQALRTVVGRYRRPPAQLLLKRRWAWGQFEERKARR